ncbi:unnamed protein product, partial [Pylaiella littoralis]
PSFFLHRVRELLDLGDQPVDMSYYGPQAVWQFCFIRSPVNYQVAGSCWSVSSPSGLSLPPALGRHVVAAACSVLLPHRVTCSPFSVVTARRCMLALFCCIPLLSVFPYVLSLPHPLPMICSIILVAELPLQRFLQEGQGEARYIG